MISSSSYPTHLCLVSSQPVPNLVPACDPENRPGKVILLVSDQMRRHAEWLGQVLAGRQVDSEIWPLRDPYDFGHVRQRVGELLVRPDMAGIALNATGGTKIMSLAAHELFRERGLPIFYVQPHRDLLLPLHPAGSAREISDRLRIPEFLQAHGYRVTGLRRETVAAGRHQLGGRLVENLRCFERALGPLNYLAGTAEERETLESDPVEARHWSAPGFDELTRLLEAEGLLKQEAGRLRFASETDRFFVNGGWLEEFLFARIGLLRNRLRIQDAAMSVVVESPSGSKNEIDLAILYNNRLHLIECKTRQFGGNSAGAGTLYKMDTLRDLGGVTARAMLASYRRLNSADRRRARDLGIELVVGGDLLSIVERTEQWLTK